MKNIIYISIKEEKNLEATLLIEPSNEEAILMYMKIALNNLLELDVDRGELIAIRSIIKIINKLNLHIFLIVRKNFIRLKI